MKLIAIVMIVTCLVSHLTAAHPHDFDLALLSPSGRDAYQQLRSTRKFAFGGIGDAELPSPGEIALRRLLREEFATDALLKLLGQAKPAGKMYVLCGLHFRDSNIFERELKKYDSLEQNKIPIDVIQGRKWKTSNTPEIIKEIRSGRFDRLLKKDLPELDAVDAEKPDAPPKTEIRAFPVQ